MSHYPVDALSHALPIENHGLADAFFLAPQPHDASEAVSRLWLDEHLLHGCAYFSSPHDTLAQAQRSQLTLICQQLHLQHGDTLLDMRCGWGELACWAASHYGAFVHGFAHTPAEYAYAVKQVEQRGLQHLITITLADDQPLPEAGRYHKAVCLGMTAPLSAIDSAACLAQMHTALKPGGRLLLHGMTAENDAGQPEGVAPLSTMAQLLAQIKHAQFEVFKVESLRRQYVLTLRHWLANLEAQYEAIAASAGERIYRNWQLLITDYTGRFDQGFTDLHQILAIRK